MERSDLQHLRSSSRPLQQLLTLQTYFAVAAAIPVKLRISNHKLNIETGRYENISRCNRICPVCGLSVEDEIHFLFDCPKYSAMRDDFFNKIDIRIPNYKHIPISTLIIQLFDLPVYLLYPEILAQ